ncbi:IreB family regulatory phosphoprotein [Clostridium sp. 'deep sea']|uniref:IreB family regulatory phosphoprotein n=1 Tax=Clostridium sp. 'deep sea' TaxID=2779445 RepID=UPI0018964FEF|nr:IreB family regulatory phosphoprotein [Clostridium sp. 'deep sea']QOR35701.1 IreB family regulatory phosphoprotein [Clostridium sp. 'deep sea']
MSDFDSTVRFKFDNDKSKKINNMLAKVYDSLDYKGYNPVSQIVGYLLSGDPAYITSYQDARISITKYERDEILEILLNSYLKNNAIKK